MKVVFHPRVFSEIDAIMRYYEDVAQKACIGWSLQIGQKNRHGGLPIVYRIPLLLRPRELAVVLHPNSNKGV